MKFTVAALSTVLAVASAMDIAADSAIGKSLISKARRVEEQNYDFEQEYEWLTTYSVKFQGCHHIKQWNDEADGEEDVRIATKRLVRFRLCPSDSCTANKAAGCNSGFGDYIIDMDTFLQSYIEGRQTQIEYDCQYHLLYSCNCQNDGNQADDWNEEYCQYDCFNDAGMAECIEQNPYQEDEQQEKFELQDYMECKQINPNNGNRRLDQQEVQYFVGPYCASQGGAIQLGLFTDDTCTEPAEYVTFKDLMGYDLPYSSEDSNIVDMECLSCIEKEDPEEQWNNQYNGNNNNNNGDQQDADRVIEMCENLYLGSGKCENNYPSGMVWNANNNACSYMEGIRIVRQDGIIDTGSSRPNAVATAFIVIFAMAFAAMAFYVWYLRTRLGVKKNTLL